MKKHLSFPLTLLTACVLAACQPNNSASAAASGASSDAQASAAMPKGLESDVQQFSYVLGSQFGIQLTELTDNGGEIDVKVLAEGIQDRIDGKDPKINDEQSKEIVEKFMKNMEEKVAKKAEENLKAGEKFLNENKTKDGVKTTDSGLQYKINKEGTGETPKLGDGVMVEYTGKLIDGTEFDSTKAQGGEPFAVPLMKDNGLIAGWIEGLQLMKEGGEYTLYIPAKLAYDKNSPSPKIPSNSVLVFDMKVVKIEKGAAKAAAEDAEKTMESDKKVESKKK